MWEVCQSGEKDRTKVSFNSEHKTIQELLPWMQNGETHRYSMSERNWKR